MTHKIVHGVGPRDAKIMFVGEALGADEEEWGVPFIGGAGRVLTGMLRESGLKREHPDYKFMRDHTHAQLLEYFQQTSNVFITNVVRTRPPNNKMRHFLHRTKKARKEGIQPYRGLYIKDEIKDGLIALQKEIEEIKPTVIVAFGNWALWALTDCAKISNGTKDDVGYKVPTGIGTWRGSVLVPDLQPEPPSGTNLPGQPYGPPTGALGAGIKVIPAYHPALIMRVWARRSITLIDLKRAIKESEYRELRAPDYNFIVRPSFEQVMETLDALMKKADEGPITIAHDIETRLKHIACYGIAWSELDAICIPFMCIESIYGYWSPVQEEAIVWKIYKLSTHPNVRNVGQGFTYDMQYIGRRWGFTFSLYSDTLITQNVLFPGTPKTLDYQASMYCSFYCYWKDEGKEWDPKTMNEDQLWIYNCKDGVNTYEIHETQKPLIDKFGLRDAYDMQMELFPYAVETMLRGVRFDEKRRGEFRLKILDAMSEREEYLTKTLGDTKLAKSKTAKPWYRSPIQQMTLFYDILGLPVQKKKGTGKRTTEGDALPKLAVIEPLLKPMIDKIVEYRSLCKSMEVLNTKLDKDSRIRCQYNFVPETHRFSSIEDAFGYGTNLQNISEGHEVEE